MSTLLDEARIQKKVKDKIEGYGRLATFYSQDGTEEWSWYITPPRQQKSLSVDGNAQTDTLICLIAALGIPFDPKRTAKVVDGKTSLSYRVTQVDPIDSGDYTQAYRIYLAR